MQAGREPVVRIRVKHSARKRPRLEDVHNAAPAPPDPDAKLDLRWLDLEAICGRFGSVHGVHLNTPYSAYVKLDTTGDEGAFAQLKKDLHGKTLQQLDPGMVKKAVPNAQGKLSVDQVYRDTFTRLRLHDHLGPSNALLQTDYPVPGLFVLHEFVDLSTEEAILRDLRKTSSWENMQEVEPVEARKKEPVLNVIQKSKQKGDGLKGSLSAYLNKDVDAKSKSTREAPGQTQPTRRRVLHYGFKFDYQTRHADCSREVGWPAWRDLNGLGGRVDSAVREALNGKFEWTADQATVNEYVPGEGIAKHIDTHAAFEDGIASLSLGSVAVIRFATCTAEGKKDERVVDVVVPRRSLFIMTGDSRYLWTHAMVQRTTDKIDGKISYRGTRLSVTYRHIKRPPHCSCDANAYIKRTYCS